MYMYVNNFTPRVRDSRYTAVHLAEGLADDYHNRWLAVPCDFPLKIKFAWCGNAENIKSTLCGLYIIIHC